MEIDRPIAIAVTLFIVLVLGFYLVAPEYQEFRDSQLELSKKEAEFEGREAYFLEVANTFRKLKIYEDELEKIDSALPASPSLASLIYFLQKKSAETGLILQAANLRKISSIAKTSDIKETRFYLEFFGSYFAFKNFLSSLEKSARLIEVESVSFASLKDTDETYPFKLIIKTYSY